MWKADMMDVYCERVGPGLLAELLNAVSNTSFLLAAWAALTEGDARVVFHRDVGVEPPRRL
jgi:hypothetical protein